jgi:hypothetical protein
MSIEATVTSQVIESNFKKWIHEIFLCPFGCERSNVYLHAERRQSRSLLYFLTMEQR